VLKKRKSVDLDTECEEETKEPSPKGPRNWAKTLDRLPDILYSQNYDGEIVIEWS
jgi:hypothetical protein